MKEHYSIDIAGINFSVVSDDGNEFVRRISEEVSERLTGLMKSGMRSKLDAAVLCALDYCGELVKMKHTVRKLEAQIKVLEADSRRKREDADNSGAVLSGAAAQGASGAAPQRVSRTASQGASDTAAQSASDTASQSVSRTAAQSASGAASQSASGTATAAAAAANEKSVPSAVDPDVELPGGHAESDSNGVLVNMNESEKGDAGIAANPDLNAAADSEKSGGSAGDRKQKLREIEKLLGSQIKFGIDGNKQ